MSSNSTQYRLSQLSIIWQLHKLFFTLQFNPLQSHETIHLLISFPQKVMSVLVFHYLNGYYIKLPNQLIHGLWCTSPIWGNFHHLTDTLILSFFIPSLPHIHPNTLILLQRMLLIHMYKYVHIHVYVYTHPHELDVSHHHT